METYYEITRSELVKAFAKWNKDYEDNPEDFLDDLLPEEQTNYLLKLLGHDK